MAHSEAAPVPSASIADVEATAYEAWFRAEVEKALLKAKSSDAVWHTQEDIERETELDCAKWQEKIDSMGHRD